MNKIALKFFKNPKSVIRSEKELASILDGCGMELYIGDMGYRDWDRAEKN